MARTITPFLMFDGVADEAMKLYTALFEDSEITHVERYRQGEQGPEGSVKRAEMVVGGQRFMCIDSPIKHDFGFTPAISIFVNCESDAELETTFGRLSTGGAVLMPLDNYGFSKRFGWLTDRFGVSWQLNLE